MEVYMFRSTMIQFITLTLAFTMIALAPRESVSQQPQRMQQPQVNVTDQELQNFNTALGKVTTIQRNAHKEMMVAVEDNGLKVETYNKILKQMRNAQGSGEVSASGAQIKKAQQASQQVQTIRNEMQKDLKTAIQGENLTSQRFKTIMQAVRTNPDLQKRMQKLQSN
ncbi:MAG: DUF4168 domain-containing protein [Caldithrix sp.]|nr:DUF4168 domain-containing protein [Caldithrix sp.]